MASLLTERFSPTNRLGDNRRPSHLSAQTARTKSSLGLTGMARTTDAAQAAAKRHARLCLLHRSLPDKIPRPRA